MIKDILVSLPVGETSSEAAVDYAISVATGFDAHGYGHSRLREFVLGGATRGLLEAMTVPVLMSH